MTKELFESKFNVLILPFEKSYNGRQPIISWVEGKIRPDIQTEFLEHLPFITRQRILEMVNELGED